MAETGNAKSEIVKDKRGQILLETKNREYRWKEYIYHAGVI